MMLQANTDITNRRRTCRRERSKSSLDGFIAKEPADLPSVDENSFSLTQQQNQEELRMLNRRLRQVKRRLLLKSVEKPTHSVDQLRGIFLQIAMTESIKEVWFVPSKNQEPPVTQLPLVEANKAPASQAPLKPCPKAVSSAENKFHPVLNTMKRNKVVASTA